VDYFEGGGQRELGVDVDLKSSGRTSLLSVVCDATNGSPRSLMPDRFVVDKNKSPKERPCPCPLAVSIFTKEVISQLP